MGISFWHMIIFLAIALVIFGPSRLPTLGRSMGEAIRGFKKGLNEDPEEETQTRRTEQIQNNKDNNQAQNTSSKNKETQNS